MVAVAVPVRAVVPALALGALSLLLGLWAEPLLALSTVAGRGLADTTGYVGAVGAP